MNNQLTDERITDFIKGVGQLARLYPGTDNGNPYPPSEILSAFVELQERRKADAAWLKFQGMLSPDDPAAPQPAPKRELVRREHAEWSDATFGNVGPVGPLKHLSKEALEAAADPSDPLEWADMQFLLWDAQRRMGLSDEFITRAMIEKLAINKSRQWPEPKDGEPRLHINEHGNSPVIPDGWRLVPIEPTEEMIVAGFESEPDELFSKPGDWDAYKSMSGCQQAAHRAKLCWMAMIAAAQPSPTINEGKWIKCSESMPEPNKFVQVSNGVWVGMGLYSDAEHLEDGERWQDEHHEFIDLLHHPVTHWQPLPAAPQETK